jgi:hypothetical protein
MRQQDLPKECLGLTRIKVVKGACNFREKRDYEDKQGGVVEAK